MKFIANLKKHTHIHTHTHTYKLKIFLARRSVVKYNSHASGTFRWEMKVKSWFSRIWSSFRILRNRSKKIEISRRLVDQKKLAGKIFSLVHRPSANIFKILIFQDYDFQDFVPDPLFIYFSPIYLAFWNVMPFGMRPFFSFGLIIHLHTIFIYSAFCRSASSYFILLFLLASAHQT